MNNDWATALVEARTHKPDKIPKGWDNLWEIAKDMNTNPTAARMRLNSCLGKTVEREKFITISPQGRIARVYHYRTIKK